MRIGQALLLSVAVMAAPANMECSGAFGVDCTQIGCEDGLAVLIVGDLPADATVRVEADGEKRTFTCAPTHQCAGFFAGWMPAQVAITVTLEDGSLTRLATPDYELLYPNGRRCGAACRQGEVSVSLP
jgi:hypothetical protein